VPPGQRTQGWAQQWCVAGQCMLYLAPLGVHGPCPGGEPGSWCGSGLLPSLPHLPPPPPRHLPLALAWPHSPPPTTTTPNSPPTLPAVHIPPRTVRSRLGAHWMVVRTRGHPFFGAPTGLVFCTPPGGGGAALRVTFHSAVEYAEDALSCVIVTKSLAVQGLQSTRPISAQVQVRGWALVTPRAACGMCALCLVALPRNPRLRPMTCYCACTMPVCPCACGMALLCSHSFPPDCTNSCWCLQLLSQHFRSFEVDASGAVVLGDVPSSRTTLEAFHSLVQAFGALVRAQAKAVRGPSGDAAIEAGGAGLGAGASGAGTTVRPRDDAIAGVLKQIGELELALQRCQQNDNVPPVRFTPEPEIVEAMDAVSVCVCVCLCFCH
jgi:hypothetical protein